MCLPVGAEGTVILTPGLPEEPSAPVTETEGKMVPTHAEALRMDFSRKTPTSVLTTPKSYPAQTWSLETLVWVLSLSFTCCVTLGKSLHLSGSY